MLKKIYKDLDLNFTKNPISKDVSRSIGDMAVVRAVRNLIMTGIYERPFQPDLGSNIRKLLFENVSPFVAAAIQKEVENTVNNFEPRATIQEISVTPVPDRNLYKVFIRFYINNSTSPIEIDFFLQRVR